MILKRFNINQLSQRTLKVLKNSFWGGANKLTSLLIAAILFPMIIREYGLEKFGFLSLLLSFSFAFIFSDLGLGTGLQNQIPRIRTEKKTRTYISSTFFPLLFVAIILFIILTTVLYLFFPNYFHQKYDLFNIPSLQLVTVFIFFICLSIPFSIVQKVETGFQKGFINSIFTLISNLLIIGTCIILIINDFKFEHVCIAYFSLQSLLIITNYFYFFFIRNPKIKPVLESYHKKTALFILSNGIIYFLIQIINLFGSVSDSFMISHFINLKEVAMYTIMMKILQLLSTPSQIIIEPLSPAFNESLINRDLNWTNKVIKNVFFTSLGYTLICGVILFYFSRTIIYYWIRQNIEIDNITLLSFCLLLIPANMGGIFSSLFNTNTFFKYFIIIITITNLLTFTFKMIYIEKYGIVALNIIHVFFFMLCYSIAFIYLKRKHLSF